MGGKQAGTNCEAGLHGRHQTEFQVGLESRKATEHLPFEHMFDPEGNEPESPF